MSMTKDGSILDVIANTNAERARAVEAATQMDAVIRRIFERFGATTVDGVLACADELAQLRARAVPAAAAESPTSDE